MNVLHVEDFAIEAHLVRHSLSWRAPGIQVYNARSVAEAVQRLEAFEQARVRRASALPGAEAGADREVPHYDVVLADLQLPDGSGLDVLRHVREHGLPVAVVMLTGSGDEESVFEALHAGADDYIAKDGAYLTQLPRTLQSAVENFRAEAARGSRKLRVLYAEPNAADIDLTLRALARSAPHLSFEVVHDPQAVIARFAGSDTGPPPDVLLLDYRLPGLTALDLVKELLQTRSLEVPVVLVTGHGTDGIARLAVKLGVADYLVKSPGYLERLPAALDGAFHRATVAREQRALRKSEREFHSLADNLPDAVLRFGRDGRIEYANPMAERSLGFDAKLVGRTLAETGLGEVAVQALDAGLRAAFARGASMQLSLTLGAQEFCADPATERTTDWRLVPERGADSQVVTVLVLARDVTEARQAEAKVRDSERQARATVDALSAQVAILDEQGTIMAVNRAWRDFAASNSPDPQRVLASVNYLHICAAADGPEAEDAREVAAGMRAVISGERDSFALTYPCHAPTEQRWYCVRITRFAGEGPVRLVVAHENVSERMLAQVALDEHRLQLEDLVLSRTRQP